MNILIIEDNHYKFNNTVSYIKKVNPDAEIVWADYAKEGVLLLQDREFDFVIIDMQMPIDSDTDIDKKAGLYVLRYLKRGISLNSDIKSCINSSSRDSSEVMKEEGYEDTTFILYNDSGVISDEFRKFLTEV